MHLDFADHVRVWTMKVDEAAMADRLDDFSKLLSCDERNRMNRFYHVEDRVRFAVTRSLLRVMLSRAVAIEPRDWRFRLTAHGRPELDMPGADVLPLRFNVSHTRGLLACAVTLYRDVGVDVEYINRHVMHDLADRFFAPPEVADLRSMPTEVQPDRFFDYWTLKEAYIKARGLGLSIPLHHFSFVIRRGSRPTIRFEPELTDDPAGWHFVQHDPSPTHRLALAVRIGERAPLISIEPVDPEVVAA